jgi:hypothetical protein
MALKAQIRWMLPLLLGGAALHAQQLPRLDGGGAKPAATPPVNPWKVVSPVAKPAAKPSANAPVAAAATPPAAPQPPTPSDLPAQPATVKFEDGLLTVHASNSSLLQILHDVTAQTGMEVEGKPEDERVFGDFGPAAVSKVMAQLLDGGPSNYMVFGMAANHAPRSLVLSPRTSAAPTVAGAVPAVAMAANNDDDDDDDAPVAVAPIRPLLPQGLERQQNEPGQGFNPQPGVRTPQQILEDMQRRRAEAQQVQ